VSAPRCESVLAVDISEDAVARIRGAMDVLPWSGPLFLISIFALSALPPFGLFRSEFQIVAGGLQNAHGARVRHFIGFA